MKVALKPHPESRPPAVTIEVEIRAAASGAVSLRYLLRGDVGAILLPDPAPPERSDGLWRHTCFEAFVRDEEGYREYNFSPSGRWAAYRFRGYREGMAPLDVPAPRIGTEAGQGRIAVRVALDLPLSGRLGLSAVIEGKDGSKSWWALAHPPGAPDFHHRDCFQLDLPPAG